MKERKPPYTCALSRIPLRSGYCPRTLSSLSPALCSSNRDMSSLFSLSSLFSFHIRFSPPRSPSPVVVLVTLPFIPFPFHSTEWVMPGFHGGAAMWQVCHASPHHSPNLLTSVSKISPAHRSTVPTSELQDCLALIGYVFLVWPQHPGSLTLVRRCASHVFLLFTIGFLRHCHNSRWDIFRVGLTKEYIHT